MGSGRGGGGCWGRGGDMKGSITVLWFDYVMWIIN